jgi:hypothetical protein
MSANKRWAGGEGEGVRAELLAQKAIYESESHGWRHPLSRLAAIIGSTFGATWGGWRRNLWRH